ncbi:MAG: IS481 family transposase, partial [Pseudomonadales bacterium]|nr:IS481 family transposase [Pseudomonadales bacterium]
MDIHKNATLTPAGRRHLVERAMRGGASYRRVAREFGTSPKTVAKWVERFRSEGEAGLYDRSSRPLHPHPRQAPRHKIKRIQALRKRRWTINHIAQQVRLSSSTVARHLKHLGLNRLSRLEPPAPVHRYERHQPGDLIHMDTKRLGRFMRAGHRFTGPRRHSADHAGWESVHVCVDDFSRISYTEVLPDERMQTVTAFLARACRYYASLGIEVRELLTDNAKAYHSKMLAKWLNTTGIKHRFTRFYRPQTNGKAERFIQTLLREWAYARRYTTSYQRTKALNPWLHEYNWHRPHGSLNNQPPIARLALSGDNLMTLH